MLSDGLACFNAVTDAGCVHQPTVVAGRKPKDLPEFKWVNTVLGNLKTSFSGCYHALAFRKYGAQYLAAFTYRFNRRFELCLAFAYLGLDFGKEPTIAGLGLDQGRVGAGQQRRIAHFDGQRDADGKTNAVARGGTGYVTIAAIEHTDTRRLAA